MCVDMEGNEISLLACMSNRVLWFQFILTEKSTIYMFQTLNIFIYIYIVFFF